MEKICRLSSIIMTLGDMFFYFALSSIPKKFSHKNECPIPFLLSDKNSYNYIGFHCNLVPVISVMCVSDRMSLLLMLYQGPYY